MEIGEARADRQRAAAGDGGRGPARTEDLRSAINHHRREGLCSEIVSVVLPPKSASREIWLTRSQAARLIWAAWRAKQIMQDKRTERAVGRHLARFILTGLYTGTRSGAICGAALMPTIGRGHVDLERGVFYRRAVVPARPKAAAAGSATRSPARTSAALAPARHCQAGRGRMERQAGAFGAQGIRRSREGGGLDGLEITPHVLRHTAATWAMQRRW